MLSDVNETEIRNNDEKKHVIFFITQSHFLRYSDSIIEFSLHNIRFELEKVSEF